MTLMPTDQLRFVGTELGWYQSPGLVMISIGVSTELILMRYEPDNTVT